MQANNHEQKGNESRLEVVLAKCQKRKKKTKTKEIKKILTNDLY